MVKNVITSEKKVRFILKMSICLILLLLVFLVLPQYANKSFASTENQYKYLSDEDIDPISARVGWDSFRKNQINDGSLISVKVEGAYYSFEKGLWAHAASTLVYDLRGYDYDYFTAYVGLNQTAGGQSNGVIYKIYTSADGRTWNIKYNEEGKVSARGADAEFVKISIKNEKYLKLEAGSNGANGGDHAVYADTKLIKEGYKDPAEALVPSTTELDTKIKDFTASNADLSTNKEYELALLKRELISKMGNYALKRFLGESEQNRLAYEWLTGNVDILRLYVMGGTPDGGSYYNSLSVLAKLYAEYSDDFVNPELLENPTHPEMTYGDLYKKMAMSVALTQSQRVGLWMDGSSDLNKSDPLRRYAIFKHLHKNRGMVLASTMDMTHMFEDLEVQEMRYVVINSIDDQSILWLNNYVQNNIDAHPTQVWRYQTPHPYIAYTWPNYANPIYFAEENVAYFNELFAVKKTSDNVGPELVVDGQKTGKVGLFDSEFVIPGGKTISEYRLKIERGTPENKVYKLWMNFRNKFGTGCVCGGISKSGSNIRGTHGIPAMVIGQPGHAALMFYSQDAEGRGYWRIDNDVSGWTLSGGGGRLLGWGNGTYAYGYSNGVYVELEQAAINDYENLLKAEKQVMLAKVYKDDLAKQEELYRKALEIQPINFDAWLGLIDVYKAQKANEDKDEDDLYDLAEEIAEALKYFPLPMYNATNLIKPELESPENTYKFTLLQTRVLTEAYRLPNNTATSFTVMQPGVTRLEAGFLLGKDNGAIATFSFDGEDAGKIVLSSRFDGAGVRWDYCLDGNPVDKTHFTEVDFSADQEHKLQLTPEELASITAETDIYVHIVGVGYEEENVFLIDITGQAIPETIYANDLENRVVGTTAVTQWSYTENGPWTPYNDENAPDLTGNKTIYVREAATGTKLASASSPACVFTENNEPDTRKYISVLHQSLHSVSSEATGQGHPATSAIDANINTYWHSAWNGSDRTKEFVIKLDAPKYISALEFYPVAGGNGKVESLGISVSMDGENWTEIVSETNWTYANTNDISTKSVDFDPAKALYVKLVGKRTQAGNASNSFMAAKMFNLFEDTTIIANFSFDGEDAGKIILDDIYSGRSWKYSVDGGTTWKDGNGDSYKLPDADINAITEENKIKIRFNGDEKSHFINIKKSETPTGGYLNDLENRVIGLSNINTLEWKYSNENVWTSYETQEPVVTGNKTLQIRTKSTKIYLPSDIVEYEFTEDNQAATRKYIPIEHLSIHAYSTQSVDSKRPFYAPNAIDGNINTMWHTDFGKTIAGSKAFITIKLDSFKNISALEFVQRKYREDDPSSIRNAIVYVSENGEDWIEAGRKENCPQDDEFKNIEFTESVYGQYVKLEIEGYGMFAAASIINLFEDTTVIAGFSFDGENAGKITLNEQYAGINWEYSIDGGTTWKAGSGNSYKLPDADINAINEENGIKVRAKASGAETTINIGKRETPATAYLNDLENRLIGVTNVNILEWKYSDGNTWTSYEAQEPVVTGDKTLQVRAKASGKFLPSDSVEYQFTQDTDTETVKYVPIIHLSIENSSSENVRPAKNEYEYARNAIDGNINTMWHTSRVATNDQRFIVIKLDTPRYITKIQYVRRDKYLYGILKNGVISTSMDGVNWEEATTITDLYNPANKSELTTAENVKDILISTPKQAQYIKIQCTKSCDYLSVSNADYFFSAAMLNLFEDKTKRTEEPIIGITLNKTSLSLETGKTENLTATINPSNTTQSKTITWSSDKTAVATVDSNGKITAVSAGTATITATTSNGKTATCTVTVTNATPVTPTGKLGDTDGNGKITTKDAKMVLQHIVKKITLTPEQISNADTDKNGRITTKDAKMILQHIVKKIDLSTM